MPLIQVTSGILVTCPGIIDFKFVEVMEGSREEARMVLLQMEAWPSVPHVTPTPEAPSMLCFEDGAGVFRLDVHVFISKILN